MATRRIILVFVHGWSVTNTDTYGGLPARLRNEAAARDLELRVRHIFLGRYISFHDEVRVPDIARAFDTAVVDQLGSELADGDRFACITHSTGGPVIRDWWQRYYLQRKGSGRCSMSHLVMLAPANFGSALAQLGKSRLSRLKFWFGGVQPGQGVLDWLELGSMESWALNASWISTEDSAISGHGVFPFVLTGQMIDRRFYDALNSYTGELGSDGVVRVASANLNSRIVSLDQQEPRLARGKAKGLEAPALLMRPLKKSPETALRVIRNASHSGGKMGVMRGVHAGAGHPKGGDTVQAILDCLGVVGVADYRKVVAKHAEETTAIQRDELLEMEDRLLLSDTWFIHDRYSMVVFRVSDSEGYSIDDFDLLLTAGKHSNPNHLPKGFFMDRQSNRVAGNTITYFVNYDIMVGTPEIRVGERLLRPASKGIDALGLTLDPRPGAGFVHYLPCEIEASRALLNQVLHPNSTTLVDIRLQRVVKKNVFRMRRMQGDSSSGGFKSTQPGDDFVK